MRTKVRQGPGRALLGSRDGVQVVLPRRRDIFVPELRSDRGNVRSCLQHQGRGHMADSVERGPATLHPSAFSGIPPCVTQAMPWAVKGI